MWEIKQPVMISIAASIPKQLGIILTFNLAKPICLGVTRRARVPGPEAVVMKSWPITEYLCICTRRDLTICTRSCQIALYQLPPFALIEIIRDTAIPQRS
jgi:hypothetical protein